MYRKLKPPVTALLLVAAISAASLASSGAAETAPSSEKDVFLLYGKPLSSYRSEGSSHHYRKYAPALAAYPNLSACTASDPDDGASHLTMSDLQLLPIVVAKEVCLFYEISRLDTPELIEKRIVELGFGEARFHPHIEGGLLLRASWRWENGSLLAPGLISALANVITGDWALRVSLDRAGRPRYVVLDGLSIMRL